MTEWQVAVLTILFAWVVMPLVFTVGFLVLLAVRRRKDTRWKR